MQQKIRVRWNHLFSTRAVSHSPFQQKRSVPFFLELQDTLLPGSRALNRAMIELGETLGIPVVATNNVHYVHRDDFPVLFGAETVPLKVAGVIQWRGGGSDLGGT